MNIFELFLLTLGLSIDGFAVSVCIGLSIGKRDIKKAFVVGLYFGIFHALMPIIGYFAGLHIPVAITAYSGYISFAILAFLGVKMIIGIFKNKKGCDCGFCINCKSEYGLNPAKMLPLSLATSIDILAVGVSFALIEVSIASAVLMTVSVVFILAVAGVMLGNVVSTKLKTGAEFAGGIVLIIIGIRMLLN